MKKPTICTECGLDRPRHGTWMTLSMPHARTVESFCSRGCLLERMDALITTSKTTTKEDNG